MTDCCPNESPSIAVGRIVGVHGLSGSVRALVLSDVPHRFDTGGSVYIQGVRHSITSSTPTPSRQVILKFHGIESPEAAQELVGQQLTVPEAAVPSLPEGEYFHYQLLDLRVFTEEGEDLGRLSEILETGSNDVYIVSDDNGELLIPALTDVICKVDLDAGVMVVRLPDGLR